MSLGSENNPLRVAVVGAGPSGFYACEALIRSNMAVEIDLIERLPSPYGLVRSGVAPDHPKLKQAIQVYDRIASTHRQLNFVGNVTIGKDLSVDELRSTHHAVILTCGAESDRRLGIPGEDLAGSHTATEFVAWYNGHPDYRDAVFDLSHETAVVIGQGNVAADVSRILLKPVDELKHTDIAQHALEALAQSKVRTVYVIGRRGPAQAKFAAKELKEFGDLADCEVQVDAQELRLNAASESELAERSNVGSKQVYELFESFAKAKAGGRQRRCRFQFLRSPVALVGQTRLEKLLLEHNELSGDPFRQSARGSGRLHELNAGILFRSIGYRGVGMPGVPFDEGRGIFPNVEGRIKDESGSPLPQLYTAGWIKRGPSGIIGTNRACAVETVKSLLEDVAALNDGKVKSGRNGIYSLLNERKIRYINYDQWKHIDQQEIERGRGRQKPREKIVSVEEMLSLVL